MSHENLSYNFPYVTVGNQADAGDFLTFQAQPSRFTSGFSGRIYPLSIDWNCAIMGGTLDAHGLSVLILTTEMSSVFDHDLSGEEAATRLMNASRQ